MDNIENVSFTVDAGIINRLGLELVSKSETALAELIKNSYDADAKEVNLYFVNAENVNGTLIIEDDGVGMNREQLLNGFMKLATTDKLHNSISEIYLRPKAGKKGIGRFSTQRLGTSLEIVTKSFKNDKTIKLTIDWEKYLTDKRIEDVSNEMTLNYQPRSNGSGTTLTISGLRDKWSDADIKRVYRYIADLIQPNFMEIDERGNLRQLVEDKRFEVNFFRKNQKDNNFRSVADPQIMFLNKSLATISGYIDQNGFGRCSLETKLFSVKKIKQSLLDTFVSSNEPYDLLKSSNIIFKVYYFIGGDRNSYYGISKLELKTILDHLDRNGGVKLYRNGFRVPKYGEFENDWLNIDKNSRIGKGIPFNNNRLLGYVQILDSAGLIFEESAGREGLIEKDAFLQLQQFISKGIEKGFLKFTNWFRTTDEYKVFNPDKSKVSSFKSVLENTSDLRKASKILNDPDSTDDQKTNAVILIEQATKRIYNESSSAINELEMIRVLAGTGLTIAEFVHEIKQTIPSIRGYITGILNLNLDLKDSLNNIVNVLSALESYMSYFDVTISKNSIRQLAPIDLRKVINSFIKVLEPDLKRRNFKLSKNITGRDLFTTSMHQSEWNTILQNLYSNSKKAILRSKNFGNGKLLLAAYRDDQNDLIYYNFQDNGSGIGVKDKDRIFEPFFTTSTDVDSEWGTGTGLGLYILKQMINNRGGDIYVDTPSEGYNTSITIKIPITKKEDLDKYGY